MLKQVPFLGLIVGLASLISGLVMGIPPLTPPAKADSALQKTTQAIYLPIQAQGLIRLLLALWQLA